MTWACTLLCASPAESLPATISPWPRPPVQPRAGELRGGKGVLPSCFVPRNNTSSMSHTVVDHYTSEIVFNSVRVIAIVIIGLGFLLLLLPEEWDVWVIKLLTRLKVRKKEEIPEGNGDITSGLPNKSRRTRPSMSSFAH